MANERGFDRALPHTLIMRWIVDRPKHPGGQALPSTLVGGIDQCQSDQGQIPVVQTAEHKAAFGRRLQPPRAGGKSFLVRRVGRSGNWQGVGGGRFVLKSGPLRSGASGFLEQPISECRQALKACTVGAVHNIISKL